MPMHDWTKVTAGVYQQFYAHWITDLGDVLNKAVLPESYYAMIERVDGNYGGALDCFIIATQFGGQFVAKQPPRTSIVTRPTEARVLLSRQNHIAVRTADADYLRAV